MAQEAQVVTSVSGYQRQVAILEWVLRSRFVTVRDLVTRFGVSYSTISRDLDALAARADLRRVRGGLMYLRGGARPAPAGCLPAPVGNQPRPDESHPRVGPGSDQPAASASAGGASDSQVSTGQGA